MEIASLIASGLGVLVATVVLFVKRKAPAAPTPPPTTSPATSPATSVFGNLMKKIVGLVDELGLEDADKHSLTQDLLNVVKEYVAPDITPGDMGDKIKALFDDLLTKLQGTQTPLSAVVPATPAASVSKG